MLDRSLRGHKEMTINYLSGSGINREHADFCKGKFISCHGLL